MTPTDTLEPRAEPPAGLTAMLTAWAEGHLPTRAAVDLLTDHGIWPDRLYRAGYITTWEPASDGPPMASIDWPTVAEQLTNPAGHGFVASGSEYSILAVALSLAGELEVRLGVLLPRLDAANTGLVATAIATACNSGVRLTANLPQPSPALVDLLAAAPGPRSTTAKDPHPRGEP